MRRVVLAAIAASVVLIGAVASTAVAGGITYGWAVVRLTTGYLEYQPMVRDQGNAPAGPVHVYHTGTGKYEIDFDNDARPGSIVTVTPLGSTSHICNVWSWGGAVSYENTDVWCWDRAGHFANTPFIVNYTYGFDFEAGGSPGLAYFWLDVANATYDPSATYSFNSRGGTNHVDHTSTGHYTVTLPGLGGLWGNVQVSAYGSTPATCYPTLWGTEVSDQVINVICRNRTGTIVNNQFNLVFANAEGLRGYHSGTSAYFWADQPTSSSYHPSALYEWTTGSSVTVTRSGTGNYTVHLPGISGLGGSAQVTAYGTNKTRCQVSSMPTTGTTQTVGVRCFAYAGAPANSRFSFVFTR